MVFFCLCTIIFSLNSWSDEDSSKRIVDNNSQVQISDPALFKIILTYYDELSDPLQNPEQALLKLNNNLMIHLKELNIPNNLNNDQVNSIASYLGTLKKESSRERAINYQNLEKFTNNPLNSALAISPYSYRMNDNNDNNENNDDESTKCYRYLNGIWQREVPLKYCQISISEINSSL